MPFFSNFGPSIKELYNVLWVLLFTYIFVSIFLWWNYTRIRIKREFQILDSNNRKLLNFWCAAYPLMIFRIRMDKLKINHFCLHVLNVLNPVNLQWKLTNIGRSSITRLYTMTRIAQKCAKSSFPNSIIYPLVIIKKVSKIILSHDLIIYCMIDLDLSCSFNSFERLYFFERL